MPQNAASKLANENITNGTYTVWKFLICTSHSSDNLVNIIVMSNDLDIFDLLPIFTNDDDVHTNTPAMPILHIDHTYFGRLNAVTNATQVGLPAPDH